jgi:FkbM family methyltransferase
LAASFSRALMLRSKFGVSLMSGSKMVLDFRNKHEIWMYYGVFCPTLQTLLDRTLRAGDLFIDCGANVGYFTFYAAGLVGNTGKVISIDANPACVARIKESKDAGHHDNVSVLEAAVGREKGTLSFSVADDPMYSSIVDLDHLAGESFCSTQRSITVPVSPLDEIFQGAGRPRCRLLKVDIEGAEALAMDGARKCLSEAVFDWIYIELHPKQLQLLNQQVDDVHRILKQYKYEQVSGDSTYVAVYRSPRVAGEHVG